MAASWCPRMCSGASTLTLLFSTTNRALTAMIKNDTVTTPASHRTRPAIAAHKTNLVTDETPLPLLSPATRGGRRRRRLEARRRPAIRVW
uniref:Secreted protein n=1 Tax=Arundo donax TaxID=35708 RepID=A0A0A9ETW7_ARUDO